MDEINKSSLSAVISCPKCSYERKIPIDKYTKGAKYKCPQSQCKEVFSPALKLAFGEHNYPDIAPQAFTHPLDKGAISALQKVSGLDFAMRKMMQFGYEKIRRVDAMANDVKVTPKTCGYIHDMVEQAAVCLGISMPDIYINQNPFPNAFTIGTEFPLITVQSGLIDLLSEDELYTVIAHEISHIKCHHILYHMLAEFLTSAIDHLGIAGNLIIPLNLALFEWSRKAELSADRGALLVTNNKDAAIKLFMKLAGGSQHISDMIEESEFVLQAKQFEKLTEGVGLNKFYRITANITRTHPYSVLRGHEINKWARSDDYSNIFNGTYLKRSPKKSSAFDDETMMCPQCDCILAIEALYCEECGHPTKKLENQYDNKGLDELLDSVKDRYHQIRGFFKSENNSFESFPDEKKCPTCGQIFHGTEIHFCPEDGTELIP